MTEDLKQQGPYSVKPSKAPHGHAQRWQVVGPTRKRPRHDGEIYHDRETAQREADRFNAVFLAGQQSATPQGISEEEIERIANKIVPNEDCQVVHITEWGHLPVSKGENIRIHIAAALRYARDNFGSRSPSTGEARIAEQLQSVLDRCAEVLPYARESADHETAWYAEVERLIADVEHLRDKK